jgi:hypothetical protein
MGQIGNSFDAQCVNTGFRYFNADQLAGQINQFRRRKYFFPAEEPWLRTMLRYSHVR